MAGIETEEMGLMAIARVGVAPVVIPLLQVSVPSHPIREQVFQRLTQLLLQASIHAEFLCCQKSIGETLAGDGNVGKTAIERSTMITVVGDIAVLG